MGVLGSSEWYGYLRRDGVPSRGDAKGTAFKGPFHLPRMLMIADSLLTDLK
jgi:N-acylglucosamine 2-epimerase